MKIKETEIWKPFRNLGYEASSLGRVRRGSKIINQRPHSKGYRIVSVKLHNGHFVTYPVHKVVMEAFFGPRRKGIHNHHKNGDKTDNRLANLERVTHSENMRHWQALPHKPLGRKNMLSDEQIEEIRRLYGKRPTQKELAIKFNVSAQTIQCIIARTKAYKN